MTVTDYYFRIASAQPWLLECTLEDNLAYIEVYYFLLRFLTNALEWTFIQVYPQCLLLFKCLFAEIASII